MLAVYVDLMLSVSYKLASSKSQMKYGIPGALLSSVQDWHAVFSLFLCGSLSDSQCNARCEWIAVEHAMQFLMDMTILVNKNIVYHFRLTY